MARSTTHRYIQELSDRDLLNYDRGILSAPESAKMKTAYIAAPLVGSIYCGSPEEEEENVEEYVSLPVSLFGKGDFYILRAKGDSMVDAGIAEGDLLVIERNCPASEGDIVVALDQEQQNTLKGTLASTTTKSALSLLTRMKHGIRESYKTEELRGSRCSSSRNKGSLKQIILIDGRCFG